MSEIKTLTKSNTKFLDRVILFNNRTVGVWLVNSVEELLSDWEEVQTEFCAEYQYEEPDLPSWDFYLVLLCLFDESELEHKSRFEIESDRFCCRKIIRFKESADALSSEELVRSIFPTISPRKPIQIIKPEGILSNIDVEFNEEILLSLLASELTEKEVEQIVDEVVEDFLRQDEG